MSDKTDMASESTPADRERVLDDFERMCEWAAANADDHGSVHAAAIDYLFAPGESYDDPWLEKLHEVYEFVAALPCGCTPESVDEDDGCSRCLLLNRQYDEPAGRGR